ncbi:hypothetical protein SAMN05421805_111157 [Saccharopolyspora antimicrobica]|uniref:Uncharacterized protein n=1 Tax=Saccharopolyspora antimicrobica TaxID=455193 RepID=A0A1I5FMZ1_9PSEU|nr:hypothetical protein SAMN05421805_111157 [Saccharopolyspora antimicrobica]
MRNALRLPWIIRISKHSVSSGTGHCKIEIALAEVPGSRVVFGLTDHSIGKAINLSI